MRRETTNRFRWMIEELLPPALRDSQLFRRAARLVWSDHVDAFAVARERAAFLTDEEYAAIYRDYPRIHEETDNSDACVERIARDIVGQEVCDVGCGTGALLRRLRETRSDISRWVGIDVAIPTLGDGTIAYYAGKIECLPFADGEFDTVICTHVLEHVLDYRRAIAELRRVARRRLIVVVPREREGRYTFNPHFNFFPYVHSFLRAMQPVPTSYFCEDVSRDIYYREDLV